MYAPHDRPYAGVIQGARYNLVMFDPALLDQVAATACGRGSGHVRLTGDRPVSPAAARQLRRTIAYLYDHVLADPAMCDSPLIVSAVSQHVAVSVLATFPHNALLEPAAADRRDAHLATMRRAVAYIDAHAHEPVTLADIAAAAATTPRAVQVAFRRYLDTTPAGYLRRVRLDGAHRDLQTADPTTGATVAAIAAYVRDDVMAAPDGPAAPLVVSTASQYLAASVLQTYPNTVVSDPTAADRRDASPGALRRAVAFIDANADLDLTISGIARAACVTPRALQLAFRRHLDTTPMGYLRRVRLTRAHEDLRAATAGHGNTVTAIAARWGFTSFRFSQLHRATYGELPGHTLRK